MRLIRISVIWILGSALVLSVTPKTLGQGHLNVLVCRDVQVRDLGASGTEAAPLSCGWEFSTSLPYVALVTLIEGINYGATFEWQLLDPSDAVFARFKRLISPPPGNWSYSFYSILPVAATEKEIVEKNPAFRYRVIEVGATRVSQMPGEWKLRVSLNPGLSMTMKFTLKP